MVSAFSHVIVALVMGEAYARISTAECIATLSYTAFTCSATCSAECNDGSFVNAKGSIVIATGSGTPTSMAMAQYRGRTTGFVCEMATIHS